jgi:AsmA-like C-terminal region
MLALLAAEKTDTPAGIWRRVRIGGLGVLLVFALAVAVLTANWPFTRAKLTSALQDRSHRIVSIQRYQTTYFPPGCVAEGIAFLRHDHKDKPPIISLQKLVVRARWAQLLTFQHKVPEVDVYGMHVLVPPRGPAADGKTHSVIPLNSSSSGKTLSIETLFVHGAALDFLPGGNGKGAFHLELRDLKLSKVENEQPFRFDTVVENSIPKGTIHAKGSFGPWLPEEPGATPVEGTFEYNNAQLNTVPGIAGVLNSQGKFAGTLDHVEADGRLSVPNFRVAHSTHTENLQSDFQAVVNGTDGDTFLKSVHVSFGHTNIIADGSVISEPNHGGVTTLLHASVANGRIEDLLTMFIASRASPLAGAISLHTAVRLHSGSRSFLERLEMSGDFESTGDRYRNPATQGAIDRLVQSARGETKKQEDADQGTALSRLTGHVTVQNGVAQVANLTLHAPETKARMDGTYNLITKDVNLTGTLQTDGKLSDTQQGFKSIALKVITPFLKKHKTTVAPFEIKGKYGNVSTRLDLDGQRKF